MSRIFDISPPVSEEIPVWPGDTPYSLRSVMRISDGQTVNLGTVQMSLHTGAHVDAPLHYEEEGAAMADLDLEPYLGPARVVTIETAGGIQVADLEQIGPCRRLLIRANAGLDRARFSEEFVWFSGEAADWLGRHGLWLIGTDAPSVDPFSSKSLEAHHAFGRHDVRILEGLQLNDIPDGQYELIALPLRLEGADGSPVRAILRELSR